jgi:hypothetical protein
MIFSSGTEFTGKSEIKYNRGTSITPPYAGAV